MSCFFGSVPFCRKKIYGNKLSRPVDYYWNISISHSSILGEYKWLAVLTWKGHKPDSDEINEISKKIENYRAKILMFDDWIPEQGYVSGILQVS